MKNVVVVALLAVIGILQTVSAQHQSKPPFDGTKLRPLTAVYSTYIPAADTTQADRTISSTLALEEAELDGDAVWRLDVSGFAHDVDIWDRRTLAAIERTITYPGATRFLDHREGGVKLIVTGNNPDSLVVASDKPIVSDGMLNYFALGTLPLRKGYVERYASFVSRKKAVLDHRLEVIGDSTLTVQAGSFDVYVVTEHLEDGEEEDAYPTWYVMQSEPRLVAKLEAPLPNGVTATIELQSVAE